MNLTLKVWRQDGPEDKGRLETHQLSGVTGDMSFLEMMDVLNDKIIREGGDPVVFDHDCREGICCLLYTSPSPRDLSTSRMPSSA